MGDLRLSRRPTTTVIARTKGRRQEAWRRAQHQAQDQARAMGREAAQRRAAGTAADCAPTIRELQVSGTTSLRAIAAALNDRGIPTPSGQGTWQAVQVQRAGAALHACSPLPGGGDDRMSPRRCGAPLAPGATRRVRPAPGRGRTHFVNRMGHGPVAVAAKAPCTRPTPGKL